jgi:arginyl-tRNA synthetase
VRPQLEDMKANYPNIKQSAGELNLRYEENDSNAVRIFRKMVTDCLSGIQQTLDTYNVRHDRWDFESELGWEGSNDRVIGVIKGSPYFVPQTPQKGGYFDLARYIEDAGFPTGKKGFVKEYPPLFVVRPDGSTLVRSARTRVVCVCVCVCSCDV